MSGDKIRQQHLDRQAYVYIRQSSQRQVEEHLESQKLQYQLVQRAQRLGWPGERIVVVDEDLGKTGANTAGRLGFQALVAAVGLGQVGIILVTDVSRLARNCADWYQLLDLASVCDTLINDAGGVYDPKYFDDRLLLGLKGTFSEVQWYTMRRRMKAARINKAKRGELALRLPVGYDRLESGEVTKTPDQEVQGAIRLVFDLFERLGSARAVLRHLRQEGLTLPRQVREGPDRGRIRWVRPSYSGVYQILKSPVYAGAYAYGKQRTERVPGAGGKVTIRSLPIMEWAVLIQDKFPGYISWEQYMRNRKRLKENGWQTGKGPGAPRSGRALLQGIVMCGRCGRQMQPRYQDKPAYVCEHTHRQYDEPRCQRMPVHQVDGAVSELFLQAMEPARLEAALAAVEQVEVQREQLADQWEKRLERARYEAELGRRRYEMVDPENRLVASELERGWEEKLQTLQRLRQEWEVAKEQELAPLSEQERECIRRLAQDLPGLWGAETTTNQGRKRLLRCLIQDVTLDGVREPGQIRIQVRWQTGVTTEIKIERVPPGRKKATGLIQRVRELAQHHPDDQIAKILNAEGVRTANGLRWTLGRVRGIRGKNKIPSNCPYSSTRQGPRGDGLIKAGEAAEQLGVSWGMICDWFRRGLLIGRQRQKRSPVWIRLEAGDLERWNGSIGLQADMVELKDAPAWLGITSEEMRTQIRAGRILTYRVQHGKQWRWYVKPPATTEIHRDDFQKGVL